MKKNSIFYFIFSKFSFFILFSIFYFLFSNSALAAVLYLEPSRAEYRQGDTFIVEVKLNTQGESINTVSAGLTFDQDLLKVIDFSQGDSILNLWPEEPNVKDGEISFIGGAPQGFRGNGRVLRIVFQGRKDGQGNINFTENSRVLLNDGFGTMAKITSKESEIFLSPGIVGISNEWQKQIAGDTVGPEPFEIKISKAEDVFAGRYFISFSTSDKQTGIDHYEVLENRIQKIENRRWASAASPYVLQDQELKSYIYVRAVDKAGNERIAKHSPPQKLFPHLIIIAILLAAGVYLLYRKRK